MKNTFLLYPHKNRKARFRLFCFPYAGGGASIFHNWLDAFPAEVEVCPIQLPGRENRILERAYRSFSILIQELKDSLREFLDVPYAFLGHSMGALICYELTRALAVAKSTQPLELFVSAFAAPHEYKPIMSDFSDEDLLSHLRHLNGIPKEFFQDSMYSEKLLSVVRDDFNLIKSYEFITGEKLKIPIIALGGNDDPIVSSSSLKAWGSLTKSSFVAHTFPGDHFFIKDAENLLIPWVVSEVQLLLSQVCN